MEKEIQTHLTLIIPGKKRDIHATEKRDKALRIVGLVFTYLFLAIAAFVILVPFYYMIAASFMTEDELSSGSFFPTEGNLLDNIVFNYSNTINSESFPYWALVRNTVIVGLCTTCGSLVITILAAFAFAKLNFRGREILFTIFLATMMIPGEMMVITNYITMSNLGLAYAKQNQFQVYLTLILPFLCNVFYIYLLRQNFKQIPNELYLAAKVDGKSDWQFLWQVLVPLAAPTLITVFILNLIESWNSYVWPKTIIIRPDADMSVLSVALRGTSFQYYEHEAYRPMYSWQMAATVLTTVPLLILFIIFRKYIMRGIARAGIKG